MNTLSLLLYNCALSIYFHCAKLISPFHPKAKKWVDGRRTVWNVLEQLPSHPHRIWFHCASLGEYEQALPLIEKIKPDSEILITFFSPSGYEIVKKKNPGALVFYLPEDSKTHAEKFLKITQPQLAVFVRYDLWYYYLTALQKSNTPAILISAVFRENAIFFQWYGSLFKTMLQCFTRIFVQDEDSKIVLAQNGFQNVTTAGDTRIDRVLSLASQGKQFPLIEKFKGEKKLFLIGSLEPKDEAVVFPLLNHPDFAKQFVCVIAPHNIDAHYVAKIQTALNRPSALYSSLTPALAQENNILIIDGIGMLSRLYAYADAAYIGGGFGEGLHNVLEPAVFGVPVCIGPKHKKFIEAVELIKRGGAFVAQDADEFNKRIFHLLSNIDAHVKASDAAKCFIQERKGATEIILRETQHIASR